MPYENNHYVPRLVLRRYGDRINSYNLKTKELNINKNIYNCFSEKNLYPGDIEKKLSDVESNVLIPYVAYSAATIFSLGADSIIMGDYSNLGPVDPQITAQRKDHNGGTSNLQFGSEDLRYFIEFIKKDIGIRKEKNKLKACENLISDVGGNTIGFAKRSQVC